MVFPLFLLARALPCESPCPSIIQLTQSKRLPSKFVFCPAQILGASLTVDFSTFRNNRNFVISIAYFSIITHFKESLEIIFEFGIFFIIYQKLLSFCYVGIFYKILFNFTILSLLQNFVGFRLY